MKVIEVTIYDEKCFGNKKVEHVFPLLMLKSTYVNTLKAMLNDIVDVVADELEKEEAGREM